MGADRLREESLYQKIYRMSLRQHKTQCCGFCQRILPSRPGFRSLVGIGMSCSRWPAKKRSSQATTRSLTRGLGSNGDVQSKNFPLTEQTPPNKPKVELDLVTTPLSRLSQRDLAKIQPGAYFSETKRLVIGSRRLGKRKCCNASAPCIGTIPIRPEFQSQFNLPSFIPVSICYAEFQEQLRKADSNISGTQSHES